MAEENRIPDEELLARILEGGEADLRPFEELVRRYQGKVTTNCRYLSGSPADAEDLAQEVFMKVYFGLAGFEGRSSFNTWVQRIKSNHCINFVKKKRLQTVEMDSSGVEAASGVPPRAERETGEGGDEGPSGEGAAPDVRNASDSPGSPRYGWDVV